MEICSLFQHESYFMAALSFPLVLFDGVCNLCNNSVQMIIRHDPGGYFRFTSLQSEAGRELLRMQGLPEDYTGSLLLWENGKLYKESGAALRIARRMNGLWPLLYAGILVPPFLRNLVYRWIARNRYKWWGKKDQCMIPSPELKQRFL